MKKSWLASLIGLAMLLIILICCVANKTEDNSSEFSSDVPLNLRGEFTEEEIFGNMTDKEILAKYIAHVGGDYVEKEMVAKIVLEYKNSGETSYAFQEIIGEDKYFYINPRYWISYVTPTDGDLNVAKNALELAKKSDELIEYNAFHSIDAIANNPGDYEVFIEGKKFKKTAHFYFVINK